MLASFLILNFKFKKGVAFHKKADIIIQVMTFRDSSMVEHSAVNR